MLDEIQNQYLKENQFSKNISNLDVKTFSYKDLLKRLEIMPSDEKDEVYTEELSSKRHQDYLQSVRQKKNEIDNKTMY